MWMNLNWLHSQRRTRRGAVSPPALLEQRALLAATATGFGATYELSGTEVLVVGNSANNDIRVGVNGAGNISIVEVNLGIFGTTDTGIAAANVTHIDLRGLAGNDSLTLNATLGTIPGEVKGDAGDDTIRAGNSAPTGNNLRGGTGNDIILGSDFDDQITGDEDNDQLNGRGGNDSVYGGKGNDAINGGDGNDKLFGGLGADVLRGDAGIDKLYANDAANNDDGARDRLFGTLGTDSFFGFEGVAPLLDKFDYV